MHRRQPTLDLQLTTHLRLAAAINGAPPLLCSDMSRINYKHLARERVRLI
jgi:hypothetical protein